MYECPDCQDEGVIVDWERNVAKICPCAKVKRVTHLLKHSQIGDDFRNKTFTNFVLDGKDQRIVQACKMARKYVMDFEHLRAQDDGHSFGIVGAVGSGKTHLTTAIANNLMSRGVGVRYFNFVTGFKEMFAQYDRGGAAVEEIRHELQTCEVLLFDDIAKGKPDKQTKLPTVSEAVFNETYAIVEHRYFNKMPILWTSEIYDELIDVIGEATATRLFQMSKGQLAEIQYTKGERRTTLNHRLEGI